MATWTDIETARLEPGKPARSVDAIALRDNPIAIAEGAEGAPRCNYYEMITDSQTWIAPKGGTYKVTMVSGGMPGAGGSASSGGRGGARGGRRMFFVTLTLGQPVIAIVGGSGGSTSFNGVSVSTLPVNGFGESAMYNFPSADCVSGSPNSSRGGAGYGAGGGGGGSGSAAIGGGGAGGYFDPDVKAGDGHAAFGGGPPGAGAPGCILIEW